MGEPEDEEEPRALQPAPHRRDDQRCRDRRRGRERRAGVAAAERLEHAVGDPTERENRERPRDEAAYRVPDRRPRNPRPLLCERDRDLPRDRRLKGERRHRRDQRDHDESDEQRVLRGVEDPGERDLENGVQPVGDYDRDPDEDPRREQAARGPFRRRRGFQL